MTSTIAYTTYGEACDHAQAQCEATNGLVRGGGYWVKLAEDLEPVLIELRISESGIARPVYE